MCAIYAAHLNTPLYFYHRQHECKTINTFKNEVNLKDTQTGRGSWTIRIKIIRGCRDDYVYYGGGIKFITSQVPGLCPPVLQVKVSWRQGKALGSGGATTGNGLFEYAAKVRH
jgi:hypothetical protein